MTTSVSIN